MLLVFQQIYILNLTMINVAYARPRHNPQICNLAPPEWMCCSRSGTVGLTRSSFESSKCTCSSRWMNRWWTLFRLAGIAMKETINVTLVAQRVGIATMALNSLIGKLLLNKSYSLTAFEDVTFDLKQRSTRLCEGLIRFECLPQILLCGQDGWPPSFVTGWEATWVIKQRHPLSKSKFLLGWWG